MHEYDLIAAWYVATRHPEIGVPDLASFIRKLPPGSSVLDLGRGDGIPISRFLTRKGFDVVALDRSPEMIARHRANVSTVQSGASGPK